MRGAVQTHLLRRTDIRQHEGTESVIEGIECRGQYTIVSLQSGNVDFLNPTAPQLRRQERIGTEERARGFDDTNDRPPFQGVLQSGNGLFSTMQCAILSLPLRFRGRVLSFGCVSVFRDNERSDRAHAPIGPKGRIVS